MNHTLLLGSVLSLASAVVFAYVGYRTSLRPVDRDAYLASRTFMAWWYALAAVTAIGAINNVAVVLGVRDLAYFVTMTHINLMLICVALWGLLFYLLYVYTGKRGWIGPLSAGYAAYFTALVYYVTAAQPSGIIIREWSVRVEYANTIAGPVTLVLVLLLIVPQILAAVAYFLLVFRVRGRTQRFRIVVVSWSIIIWFGTTLAASFGGLSQFAAWNIISRLLALAAALAILAALSPPQWMRRRFGLEPIIETGGNPNA